MEWEQDGMQRKMKTIRDRTFIPFASKGSRVVPLLHPVSTFNEINMLLAGCTSKSYEGAH